ncbi:MAG: hypothetical protein EU541_06340 [Promethearchaeota archaeon]|nr:MAG: hypothetical protein EU541_06340 [Candidatus Lokiarchaeota archaeon]
MILESYIDGFTEGIKFLMAFGSIMGLLILIAGLIGMLIMPKFKRNSMCVILVLGFVLLMLCGVSTGLEYFGVRI